MNKKKIFGSVFTVVMTLGIVISSHTNVYAYVPIGQDYHEPASKIETDYFFENDFASLERSDFIEQYIQAPLVKYNPYKLKKNNAKYSDGLKECYISQKGGFRDQSTSGTNHGGGYISLTKGSLLVNSSPSYGSGGMDTNPKDYNIYALSTIAADYAHECGHWYYDDALNKGDWGQTQKTADRDAMAMEERADAFGIRLLENVPHFSVGGDMIAIRRMAEHNYDNWFYEGEKHPSGESRWKKTYAYIKNMANNRVWLANESSRDNGIFYIKDKQGEVYGIAVPNQYEFKISANIEYKGVMYNKYDRLLYVMGQVAWAIKNDCWDKEHVYVDNASHYFKDLPQNTGVDVNVLVAKKDNGEYKIIDILADDVGDKLYYTSEEQKTFLYYINGLLYSAGYRY